MSFLYRCILGKANANRYFLYHPKIFQQKQKAFLKCSCKTGEGEERSHKIMTGLEQMLYSERLYSGRLASSVDLSAE